MAVTEIISIIWLATLIAVAVLAFRFANADQNSDFIERMGAFIFMAIALTTVVGAMMPQFIAYTLHIPWPQGSTVNTFSLLAGMVCAWAIFSRAIEWLVGLTIFMGVAGGIALIVTG